MVSKRKQFKYHPLSIREILREMKQSIDLMIDIAYSAVIFNDKYLAEETYHIEQRIHELVYLLNYQTIQVDFTNSSLIKQLEPVLMFGFGIDQIANALADTARVIYINNIGRFIQYIWKSVPEPIVKIQIPANSPIVATEIDWIDLRSRFAIDLIAIRRKDTWDFSNTGIFHPHDIMIVKAEISAIRQFQEFVKDPMFKVPPDNEIEEIQEIEHLSDESYEKFLHFLNSYIQITDISEAMIELAIAAIYFNNTEIAEDLEEIEELMDGLIAEFERELLKLSSEFPKPTILQGFMRVGFNCETIADAASNISENILKGFNPSHIFQLAFEDTNELLVREVITANSYFKGKKIADLHSPKYRKGFYIIAIKHKDNWIYQYTSDFVLHEGDLLIGLGPEKTFNDWRKEINPDYENETEN